MNLHDALAMTEHMPRHELEVVDRGGFGFDVEPLEPGRRGQFASRNDAEFVANAPQVITALLLDLLEYAHDEYCSMAGIESDYINGYKPAESVKYELEWLQNARAIAGTLNKIGALPPKYRHLLCAVVRQQDSQSHQE